MGPKKPTAAQLKVLQRVAGGRIAICEHSKFSWRRGSGTTVTWKVYVSEVGADERPIGEHLNRQTVGRCEDNGWIEVVEGWARLTDAGRALLPAEVG